MFCFVCACQSRETDQSCPRCNEPVQRIEKDSPSPIFTHFRLRFSFWRVIPSWNKVVPRKWGHITKYSACIFVLTGVESARAALFSSVGFRTAVGHTCRSVIWRRTFATVTNSKNNWRRDFKSIWRIQRPPLPPYVILKAAICCRDLTTS